MAFKKKEVEIITSNFKNYYLFIDDFKVPGLENDFHFDKYGQQECSYEYIKNDIKEIIIFIIQIM